MALRKPYGTTHNLTTKNGSRVTVHNSHDEFGRGSSHIVTGFTAAGYSAYFARNVSAKDVAKIVRNAENAGWSGIASSIEAF